MFSFLYILFVDFRSTVRTSERITWNYHVISRVPYIARVIQLTSSVVIFHSDTEDVRLSSSYVFQVYI